MKRHTFVIKGKPVPKGRPRFTRGGNTYTDKKTKDAEALVRGSYLESNGPMFTTPVQLTMTFFPDKTEITISEIECHAGSAIVSSDIDNLIKLIMDGLHDAAYENDKIVYKINAVKSYIID